MKQTIILAGLVVVALSTANAATKCIALDSEVRPSSYSDDGDYHPGWTLTYSDGMVLKGVGVCASGAGSVVGSEYDTVDTITFDSYGNTYCWCRMISPVVSGWVLYGEPDYCAKACGHLCAHFGLYHPALRAALFGSVH